MKTATHFGPMSSFTLCLTELLGQEIMASNDWKGIAEVCLIPGNYLFWKGNFFKHVWIRPHAMLLLTQPLQMIC